jgi:hypothetical protein
MQTTVVTIVLAVCALLCLLFALVASFPALAVGRDALFLAGVYLAALTLGRLA